MRARRSTAGPARLILFTLIVSVSLLQAAKSSSGRQGQAAGGSFVQAIVNGKSFIHPLSNGELAEDARDGLVAEINSDTRYSATSSTVPSGVFEPDDVFLEVLAAGNNEVANLVACENDATYLNSGVHIAAGRSQAVVLKPTAVAGGGIFNVRLDLLNGADVDETINTTAGDISGLISALITALEGQGLTVMVTPTELRIGKDGDKIVSVRVSSDDALINYTCAGLQNQSEQGSPVPGLPFLQPTGVVLLVTGLLLSGILMLRRKARA